MKRYTEAEIAQVQTLKKQGKTVKYIARTTKIPKGSIAYLLKRPLPKTESTAPVLPPRILLENMVVPPITTVSTSSLNQLTAILVSDMDANMKVSLMKTLVEMNA